MKLFMRGYDCHYLYCSTVLIEWHIYLALLMPLTYTLYIITHLFIPKYSTNLQIQSHLLSGTISTFQAYNHAFHENITTHNRESLVLPTLQHIPN